MQTNCTTSRQAMKTLEYQVTRQDLGYRRPEEGWDAEHNTLLNFAHVR